MCRIMGGQWSPPSTEPVRAQLETKEAIMERLGEWTRTSPTAMIEEVQEQRRAEKGRLETQQRNAVNKRKRLEKLNELPLPVLDDKDEVIPGASYKEVREILERMRRDHRGAMCAELVRWVGQDLADNITAQSQGKFLERVVFRELGIEERIEPDKKTLKSIGMSITRQDDEKKAEQDEHQDLDDAWKDYMDADTLDEEEEEMDMEDGDEVV